MKNFDPFAASTHLHTANPQLTSIKVKYRTSLRKPNDAATIHPLEHPRWPPVPRNEGRCRGGN